MPIFDHEKDDLDRFLSITSQLVVNGVCKQVKIVKCFGVSDIGVKRWVKRYKQSRELGEFVSKKKPKNSKLTDRVKTEIQYRYSQGDSLDDIINDRKHFMDNIKMIAYRAETSMYNLIKLLMNVHHRDESRKLLQQVYSLRCRHYS